MSSVRDGLAHLFLMLQRHAEAMERVSARRTQAHAPTGLLVTGALLFAAIAALAVVLLLHAH